MKWRVEYLDTVDSTNIEAARRAAAGAPEGLVIVAAEQTAGRGRRGRHFYSPAGKGLYMTALLRPPVRPEEGAMLTAWAGVAACDAVEKLTGHRPRIKWTNDLILHNKKLGGILVESRTKGQTLEYAAVGIGINVNHLPGDFEPGVCEIATSLRAELGREFSHTALTSCLLEALGAMREGFPHSRGRYLAHYRADCLTPGHQVRIVRGDRTETAFAEGIGENYELVVRFPDGKRERLTAGEVSVRGLPGYL